MENKEELLAKVDPKVLEGMTDSEIDEAIKVYQTFMTSLEKAFTVLREVAPSYLDAEEIQQFREEIEFIEKERPFHEDCELFQERFGFSDFLLYCFQKIGNGLYEQGDYEDSLLAYEVLVFLNPYVFDYWLAYGHAQRQLNHLDEAIQSFMMAGLLEGESPLPHFLVARCFIEKRAEQEADEEIEFVTKMLDEREDKEQWGPLLQEVKILRQAGG